MVWKSQYANQTANREPFSRTLGTNGGQQLPEAQLVIRMLLQRLATGANKQDTSNCTCHLIFLWAGTTHTIIRQWNIQCTLNVARAHSPSSLISTFVHMSALHHIPVRSWRVSAELGWWEMECRRDGKFTPSTDLYTAPVSGHVS